MPCTHIKCRSSYRRRNKKKRNIRRAKSAAEFDSTTIQAAQQATAAVAAVKKRNLFRSAVVARCSHPPTYSFAQSPTLFPTTNLNSASAEEEEY